MLPTNEKETAMVDALIIDACRTPRGIGKAGKGALSGIHPQQLGAAVLRALAERTGINTADVDDIIWGTSSQRGPQSGDLGRMSALDAGYDVRASGVTLDRFCGSGITSVNMAAYAIMSGSEDLVIAGGPDDDLVNISASDLGTLTQIGARTRLSLKPGVNQCFSIGNVQYGEDFRYAGGPDDDTLSLNGNTVGTDVILLVSNGTNGVGIFGTDIGDDLTVKAGSGDDSVQIDMASSIGGTQTLILGSGNNTQP